MLTTAPPRLRSSSHPGISTHSSSFPVQGREPGLSCGTRTCKTLTAVPLVLNSQGARLPVLAMNNALHVRSSLRIEPVCKRNGCTQE